MKAKFLFLCLPALTKDKENVIAIGSKWRNNNHFSAFRNRGRNLYFNQQFSIS